MAQTPEMNRIAVVSVRDRFYSYPTSGLTPEKLARILRQADEGDIALQMEAFAEMEEKDLKLGSLLQTRKNAVLGLNWEVMPADESEEAKRRAELVKKAMEFEGLEDTLLDLLDAIGKGFSVCEIEWNYDQGMVLPKRIPWVDTRRFTFDLEGNMRLITDENPTGMLLPTNKFMIHRYKARSGSMVRAGIIRSCAWMYMFKNYSIKDWMTFLEVFGMPIRVGKYEPGTPDHDRAVLERAVQAIGSDAAAVISKNTMIEFIQTAQKSADPFKDMVALANSEMAQAVLGQTLSSDVGSSGSRALGQTHGEVRQDLLEADCKGLAETFRRYLFKPLIFFNFGDSHLLPWLKFHYEPPEDMLAAADLYKKVQDMGVALPANHVYEKFGIPQPKDGEAVLTAPKQNPVTTLSFSERDSIKPPRTNPAQANVDRFVQDAVQAAGDPVGQMIETIKQVIAKSSSFQEAKQQLEELIEKMEFDPLQETLQQSIFAASLFGRKAVLDEVDQDG
ncbi:MULTISPECIES: DUF935 domain-containing protein [Brevibacillus]|uniref:DUF935 domain-containing protein n=1 Tax=Brevibacillus TaxID=55080 RepID=UPI000D0F6DC0|nr:MULTISPECIES: DUF935 domain-containing protein [Brevibacillus]PSJ66957.1 DUF935 domain-containing protein [Brevibacillus brevis]RED27764.1 phage gp29-like protein [Brevibacillus brevis]TQK42130.1 phage gp29-like protein [Brevibacillus sp. AG162]VEF86801.1 Mu-like prophage protein gp29 [Brevibacillus brevis]GEC88604.1 hypothetical protein BBR01nite_09350 [Brevibacillus brevis]